MISSASWLKNIIYSVQLTQNYFSRLSSSTKHQTYIQQPTNISAWVLNRFLKVNISKTEFWFLLPHCHTCSSQNLFCLVISNSILLVVLRCPNVASFFTLLLCHSSICRKNSVGSAIKHFSPPLLVPFWHKQSLDHQYITYCKHFLTMFGV